MQQLNNFTYKLDPTDVFKRTVLHFTTSLTVSLQLGDGFTGFSLGTWFEIDNQSDAMITIDLDQNADPQLVLPTAQITPWSTGRLYFYQDPQNGKPTWDLVLSPGMPAVGRYMRDNLQAGAGINIVYDNNTMAMTLSAVSDGTKVTVLNDTGSISVMQPWEAGSVMRLNNAIGTSVTVPLTTTADIAVESVYTFRQVGAGQVTFTPEAGVTLNVPIDLLPKTRVQGSTVMLHKVAADEWDLTGDLAPQ